MNISKLFPGGRTARMLACSGILLLCTCTISYAQEDPPRPIAVFNTQALNFGAFFQGVTGGTVTVSPDGSRSITGDIVQANLGFTFQAALFEIDANVGTVITIMNGPDINLTGNNGGTLSMHVGTASIGAQTNVTTFTTTAAAPARTLVNIGGTLTAGNAFHNPAGAYSGTFNVIFVQQ